VSIAVANAPCSYGAFDLTVGVNPHVPDPVSLLDDVAAAGYVGIDLGPAGYLGDGEELGRRLAERSLSLAGGYLGLPFHDPLALAEEVRAVDALLDAFDQVEQTGPPPRPTLADAGSPARAANPGRAARDRSLGLGQLAWARFAEGLTRVVARCRERGYEPTFHHHTATYVEAVWEIERLLDLTEIGLCLDTGHVIVGGGDPLTCLRQWAPRINHVHVKDVRGPVVEQIVREGAPLEEIWRRRAFCALGEGDVQIDQFARALGEIGYTGWLVVEQDIFPDPIEHDRPARDQAANREFLRARGL
jgi:inosose dehydratase